MYRKYFKRLFDLTCSLLALIVLFPFLLMIALLVRIKLGKPIFFKQRRPGFHEKIFTLYKFRTMIDQNDEQGNLLPDEARLTKFGKMLRSSSLDELPELWNILKGDMSVVGPRPLLEKYIPLYTAEQRKRHQVRPGLTGLAQVSGRNEIVWEKKFQLDVEYIKNISFLSDIRIILQTIKNVFSGKGISSATSATMEEFLGS
ncbi:putative sugar transferase EpsL [bioreactor metagenome]|uniref:Putative sugar transferase EpsL n=1 Tax=bioreactor metagenome TaxID=1076179 RepID=A0A644TYN1_9ZZZZ